MKSLSLENPIHTIFLDVNFRDTVAEIADERSPTPFHTDNMFKVLKTDLRFFSSASSANFLSPAISSSDAKSSVLSDCVFCSETKIIKLRFVPND